MSSGYALKRTPGFDRDVRRLTRKYRRLEKDLETFFAARFKQDPRSVSDKIPGVPRAWKARAPIRSANIAENRGLRVIHMLFEHPQRLSLLLMLYTKSEAQDVTKRQVKRALEQAGPAFLAEAQQHGVDPALFQVEIQKVLDEFD